MKRFALSIFAAAMVLATAGAIAGPQTASKLTHINVTAGALACPQTSGTITLGGLSPRLTGVSPLLVFFNSTGTTDSATLGGANSAFLDVNYAWGFGDGGASGTGTWAYGSNPGGNSMNAATGAAAAHVYVVPDGSGDQTYTAQVTAKDGTSTASCSITVTVYDPSGSNGFPGSATTCVSSSGTPVAGNGGCPAGASVLNASTYSVLNANLTGKRYLFKCGDTFTGDNYAISGSNWSVGAYGGCQGTTSNRPIFSDTTVSSPANSMLLTTGDTGDGRIADIDFESHTAGYAVDQTVSPFLGIEYQITLYNLNTSGTQGGFQFRQMAQSAVIRSTMQNMGSFIGVYFNLYENNPPYSGHPVNNLDYEAAIGNLFNGTGNTGTGAGQEVFRTSSARYFAYENNTIENANSIGGVIKVHQGNTYQSCWDQTGGTCYPCTVGAAYADTGCWTGDYTELGEISDNWFGGTSGGVAVDIEPQSNTREERLRNITFERNFVTNNTGSWGSPGQMRTSMVTSAIRNNVFVMNTCGSECYAEYAINVGQLGTEPVPSSVEVYHNTIYIPTSQDNLETAIALGGNTLNAAAINSFVEDNLFFATSGTHTTVLNNGTGNTVSSNTTTSTSSPGFTDGSGTFSVFSDFAPTANYSGATTVPVLNDARGTAWGGAGDLGAVHH